MIIHNPYWIIKCANIPLFLGFSRSFNHSGFCQLIFTSLIRISAINPKSKHYVTLATPRVVPVRRAKAFICRKVVQLARVTLPAEVRQLAHLDLDPRSRPSTSSSTLDMLPSTLDPRQKATLLILYTPSLYLAFISLGRWSSPLESLTKVRFSSRLQDN